MEGFLTEKLGGPIRIVDLRQLTGGASRDTWSLDAETSEGRLALVIRRDLGGQIVEEALGRDGEFAVLGRAHEAGICVPRPRWLCMDESVLGAAFFVMDRLEGESVGRRVVREPSLAAARKRSPLSWASSWRESTRSRSMDSTSFRSPSRACLPP